MNRIKNNIIPFYSPFEKYLIKSKNCYLFDSDGNKYIDFEAGVWCANLGHSNQRIVQAMENQIKRSIHHGYLFKSEEAERLSIKLQYLTDLVNSASVFLSSGSEAVNLAITIAEKLTNRKKILKIDHSYLSAFGPGHIMAGEEYQITIGLNDWKAIKHIDFSGISAFLVETGGASLGVVRFPEKYFLEELVRLASKNGCLIVAEEVTTGMGRTGKWFGFQHYDFAPDIVVTGKALGNGYPVSGVTINAKTLEKFNNNYFRYMQSHQNDPLGCAIGLEVIDVMESDNILNQACITGDYFIASLHKVWSRHPDVIKDIRGRGLMLAMEFDADIDGKKIWNGLFEKGVVTGFNKNTLKFLPPLVIEKEDIDLLLNVLDELLKYPTK